MGRWELKTNQQNQDTILGCGSIETYIVCASGYVTEFNQSNNSKNKTCIFPYIAQTIFTYMILFKVLLNTAKYTAS